MEKQFDRDIVTVGVVFLTLSLLHLAILLLKPYDENTLENINWLATIIAFIVAYVLCFNLVKLYGHKSTEGRFWVVVLIMLSVIFVGFFVSELLVRSDISHDVYSIFVAAAYLIFIFGILDKFKSAGVKPKLSDIGLGVLVVFVVAIIISLFINNVISGTSQVETHRSEHLLTHSVAIIAFILIFLSVLMARVMGGYVSYGWYFMALATSLNSFGYTITSVLHAIGRYSPGHYIWSISLMALTALAFSAYYQYKKHMAIICKYL